jgi:hypothetical protein
MIGSSDQFTVAEQLRSLLMRLHILPKRSIDSALVPRTRFAKKLQNIRIQPNRNLLLVLHRHQRPRPRPLDPSLRRNITVVDLAVLQRAQLFSLRARQLRRIRRIQTKPNYASSLLFHICQPLVLISVASSRRASCKQQRSLVHPPIRALSNAFHQGLFRRALLSDSHPEKPAKPMRKKSYAFPGWTYPFFRPSQTPRNQYSTTFVVTH